MKKILYILIITILLVGCSTHKIEPTEDILDSINEAKEASNLRSVEAYAKAIEYGVIQYEYKNNGELPTSYCDIKQYVSYTNTDITCEIIITEDYADVIIKHCKVGDYSSSSYRYDGSIKNDNRGAEKEEVTEFGYPESCY